MNKIILYMNNLNYNSEYNIINFKKKLNLLYKKSNKKQI